MGGMAVVGVAVNRVGRPARARGEVLEYLARCQAASVEGVTYAEMARAVGYCEATIHRTVRRLKKEGAVVVIRQYGRRGESLPNRFALTGSVDPGEES